MKCQKNLRKQILTELNVNVLLSNIVFAANFSLELLKDLSIHLQERVSCPGEIIDTGRTRKDGDNKFYFLAKGRVDLIFKTTQKPLKTLTLGKYFGDVSFFADKETKVEARSVTYSRVYELSKKAFLKVLDEYPNERESYCSIRDKINLYNDYSDLRIKCFVCGQEDHNVAACFALNVSLKSEEIINIAKQADFAFRRGFVRSKKRTHFKVFQPHPEVCQEIYQKYNQCSLIPYFRTYSLNYISDLPNARQVHDDVKKKSKLSSIIERQKGITNRWGSKSLPNIPTADLLGGNTDCKCQHCMNRKSCIQNVHTELCDLEQEKEHGFNINDTRPSEEAETLIFDKVKIFEKYFPHNNVDNVLHFINSANENRRLAKSQKADGVLYKPSKKRDIFSRFKKK